MTQREKVISDVISAFDDWENNRCCPGEDWSDVHQSRDMVIALLKAQEPRVMMVDEVGKWVMIDRVDRKPIAVEVRDKFITWIISDEYDDLPECDLSGEFYNKTWRCWTSRPDQATREATPWN